MTTMSRTKKMIAAGTLVLAGFGVGAGAMVITSASAADTGSVASDRGGRGETALTGTTLEKVSTAVKAKYAGATIERAETDSGGVYEAHITTTDGDRLTVLVGKDFAVTGTETGGREGHGRRGGGEGETPLTGDTLAKVTSAVKAKYAGATIERAETDNGGVYEAHITTAAGERLTVLIGKDFAITGTDTH